MNNGKVFVEAKNLEVYKLAKDLSVLGWEIYEKMDWQTKKINGDQFIESTDSVGANIVEGYGRFHFLDKIKFYYNARGSLFECWQHWIVVLFERGKVTQTQFVKYNALAKQISIKLNNFISSTYRSKDENM